MLNGKKVAVIMGSDSDFPVVSAAVKRLKALEIPCEVHVMSAHRTPDAAADFSKHAKENGFGVIIAAAGKAAHLGGVLAAHTTLPVIGIPSKIFHVGWTGRFAGYCTNAKWYSSGNRCDRWSGQCCDFGCADAGVV